VSDLDEARPDAVESPPADGGRVHPEVVSHLLGGHELVLLHDRLLSGSMRDLPAMRVIIGGLRLAKVLHELAATVLALSSKASRVNIEIPRAQGRRGPITVVDNLGLTIGDRAVGLRGT
jgi:hypothetical protein